MSFDNGLGCAAHHFGDITGSGFARALVAESFLVLPPVIRSARMAQQTIALDECPSIERPWCAACEVPMWLARIQPDKPGYDKRTFECPVCHDEIVVVVTYAAGRQS